MGPLDRKFRYVTGRCIGQNLNLSTLHIATRPSNHLLYVIFFACSSFSGKSNDIKLVAGLSALLYIAQHIETVAFPAVPNM